MREFAIAAFALLVTSCGQQVCVGGLGDCGYDPATAPSKGTGTSTQSGGTDVMISATSVPLVMVGQTIEFKSAGGRGPYTYKMPYPTPNIGKMDWSSGSNCIYTAPAALTAPQTKQVVRIQSVDQDGKVSIELPFLVVQTPP